MTTPRQRAASRPDWDAFREALRLPASRAMENLADVLRYRTPRWPDIHNPSARAATADSTATDGTGPAARWQTQDEATAWLRCPDRRTTHILDGDPAVEHARAHGTDGELTPCPSCPGPALVRAGVTES